LCPPFARERLRIGLLGTEGKFLAAGCRADGIGLECLDTALEVAFLEHTLEALLQFTSVLAPQGRKQNLSSAVHRPPLAGIGCRVRQVALKNSLSDVVR